MFTTQEILVFLLLMLIAVWAISKFSKLFKRNEKTNIEEYSPVLGNFEQNLPGKNDQLGDVIFQVVSTFCKTHPERVMFCNKSNMEFVYAINVFHTKKETEKSFKQLSVVQIIIELGADPPIHVSYVSYPPSLPSDTRMLVYGKSEAELKMLLTDIGRHMIGCSLPE